MGICTHRLNVLRTKLRFCFYSVNGKFTLWVGDLFVTSGRNTVLEGVYITIFITPVYRRGPNYRRKLTFNTNLIK